VEIDDAEEGIAEVLRCCVLAKTSAVIPEMLSAGGLDAGKDAHGSGLIIPALH
jgi:hypothetical protein